MKSHYNKNPLHRCTLTSKPPSSPTNPMPENTQKHMTKGRHPVNCGGRNSSNGEPPQMRDPPLLYPPEHDKSRRNDSQQLFVLYLPIVNQGQKGGGPF